MATGTLPRQRDSGMLTAMKSKLRIDAVMKFTDGLLSMGTVEGLDSGEKYWIIYAANGKYAIRRDGQSYSEKEQVFDSPQDARLESQRNLIPTGNDVGANPDGMWKPVSSDEGRPSLDGGTMLLIRMYATICPYISLSWPC